MQKVALGNTGLQVTRLGVGMSEIGYNLSLADAETAGRVLNHALDTGINFIDTAECYGTAEELVGITVARRRDEFVLATKAGHLAGGYQGQSWTYRTVADSIDRSLQRMRTDRIDLVQLHSCGVDVLSKGEVIKALQDAKAAGKTRFIGYSGDNEAAHWAVESGHFDTLQTSFNLVEQRARTTGLLKKAKERGMGIIVKRPIANGAWGAKSSPSEYASQYFERAKKVQAAGPIPAAPDDRILLSIGFTFAQPDVDVAIVGTRNPAHMAGNIRLVETRLPIDQRAVEELRRRFERLDDGWTQLM
ncbi:MAG: aldo/keto reductase [Chloroflexi bacterium]|nr:aldo/keto reductase [Chloroflexota bacterium]